MSLRAKLLLAIVSVNVAIVGALTVTMVFWVRNFEQRQHQKLEASHEERFRLEVSQKAENLTAIQRRPDVPFGDVVAAEFWRDYVEDGIIINNVADQEINITPSVIINVKGAKSRTRFFDHDLGVRRIREAYFEGKVLKFENDASGESWMAVPFLRLDSLVEAFAWFSQASDKTSDEVNAVRKALGDRIGAAGIRAAQVREIVSQGIAECDRRSETLSRSPAEMTLALEDARLDVMTGDWASAIPALQALALRLDKSAQELLDQLFDDARESFVQENFREALQLLEPMAICGIERGQRLLARVHATLPWTPQELGGAYVLLRPLAVPQFDVPLGFLVTIMVSGLLLLVVITFGMLRRVIVRPLERLLEGARRVGRGDYDHPVPSLGTHDEVGTMVDAFNGMMNRVGDYHRNLEERVQEATDKAEAVRRHLVIAQRLAATGTLASGIAHEINNPLGGLINAARSLRRRHKEDEFTVRYLDLIADGLLRIGETVRKVLAFSPRTVEPSTSSVRDIITRAIDLASHRLKTRGVSVHVGEGDANVLVAPGEIQQVFLNLIINAADANEPGGRIDFEIKSEAKTAVIDVSDSGCGMSREEQEKAFDLFFSTKEVGEGTGLGLSIVHHIVSNHGGTIDVDSVPGKGTRFSIRLPLANSIAH